MNNNKDSDLQNNQSPSSLTTDGRSKMNQGANEEDERMLPDNSHAANTQEMMEQGMNDEDGENSTFSDDVHAILRRRTQVLEYVDALSVDCTDIDGTSTIFGSNDSTRYQSKDGNTAMTKNTEENQQQPTQEKVEMNTNTRSMMAQSTALLYIKSCKNLNYLGNNGEELGNDPATNQDDESMMKTSTISTSSKKLDHAVTTYSILSKHPTELSKNKDLGNVGKESSSTPTLSTSLKRQSNITLSLNGPGAYSVISGSRVRRTEGPAWEYSLESFHSLTRQTSTGNNRNRFLEDRLVVAAELSPPPEDDNDGNGTNQQVSDNKNYANVTPVLVIQANPDDFFIMVQLTAFQRFFVVVVIFICCLVAIIVTTFLLIRSDSSGNLYVDDIPPLLTTSSRRPHAFSCMSPQDCRHQHSKIVFLILICWNVSSKANIHTQRSVLVHLFFNQHLQRTVSISNKRTSDWFAKSKMKTPIENVSSTWENTRLQMLAEIQI